MKKVKKSIPLAILSALLASCADARTPGTDDQGSMVQSENTENELSSRLDELSAGFDVDISVNGENYGRFALEENGVTVGFSGEDPVY